MCLSPPPENTCFSVPQLPGVVLVSEGVQLSISFNRAENTIAIVPPGRDPEVSKVAVGVPPNGLAYGRGRRQMLVANVGNPATQAST